jgi:hypothetical protein
VIEGRPGKGLDVGEIGKAGIRVLPALVTRGIFKTGINVGFFKVGEVLQDLLRRHAAGNHVKHMAHRHSHAPNCWLTTAHIRFDRDAIDRHASIL